MSEDMVSRVHQMANRTWDVIEGDILTLLVEQGEIPTIPKGEVVEIVCDAGYMMTHGGDKEAYHYWKNLPAAKRTEIVSKAFIRPTYGW